jgi:DNA-binding transcriptional regulator YiaG
LVHDEGIAVLNGMLSRACFGGPQGQDMDLGRSGPPKHGTRAPTKCHESVVEFADAKAIREGLGLSQSAFCRAFGIPLKTLQHWEQRRHNPDRTASAYLWTIEQFPNQVRQAQMRRRKQHAR